MKKFLIAILMVFSLGIFMNINNVKAANIYDYTQLNDAKCAQLKAQIQELKRQYPNYEFKIYDTGQTWENAINMEYQGHGHGNSPKNLTYKTSSYNGMWICPICNTTLYDNSLYCASTEALQYMMDPRNSISLDSIFQFEDLTSNSATIQDISRMVSGTFLNDAEVIQAIFDGCNENNISAYYIVTLLIQEQGTNGSTLSRGYNGYYNFFNIGAYGNGASAIINNGFNYAKNNGWNTKSKAIRDGIRIIGSRYVGKGQSTIYFQKFNVTPVDMYNHQYQQGIMAAESESRIMKKYYNNAGTIANKRTFLIPVFDNMPSNTSPRPDTNKTNTISYETAKVNVSSSLRVYSSPSANHLELASLPANANVKILKRATSTGFNGYYLDLVVCESNGVYGYAARGSGEKTYLVPTGSSTQTPTVTPEVPITVDPYTVACRTHVQDDGWHSYVKMGEKAGTEGQAKRLEAFQLKINTGNYSGGVKYASHVQNIGWQDYVTNENTSGTEGKSLRVEAIKIELTGEIANHYDIYYRTHCENYGWLGWAKNGNAAGTAGQSLRLEAIQIMMVQKGGNLPQNLQSNEEAYKAQRVAYCVHAQDHGWLPTVYDGAMGGTQGESRRLEALKICLSNPEFDGGIEYQTHIENIGWTSQVSKNGEMAGTQGKSLRLEAITIKLTGTMSEKYDIYYRTHCQNFGWLGWAKNGEKSGSEGYSYRLEAIEIKLVPKGGAAPGSTENKFILNGQ